MVGGLLWGLSLLDQGTNLPGQGKPDEIFPYARTRDCAGAIARVGARTDQWGIAHAPWELTLHTASGGGRCQMAVAVTGYGSHGSEAMGKASRSSRGDWAGRRRNPRWPRRNRTAACMHDRNKFLPAHLSKKESGRLLFQALRPRERIGAGADHHDV